MLRRYYPAEGPSVAARLPGRTPDGCRLQAARFGIEREGLHSLTLDTVRAKCRVDRNTGCWHWLGCKAPNGTPRIAIREPGRKRRETKSGARAVFILLHGRAPRGLAFMGCATPDCVSPVHVREAATRRDMGEHHRLSGRILATRQQRRAGAERQAA